MEDVELVLSLKQKKIFRLVRWHSNHKITATHALRVHGTKALQMPTNLAC